jgi:hypothetical protein
MDDSASENVEKREELAALLADEQDDRAAQRIDSLIAGNPSLIREKTALNESWELLAFLPMPAPKEDFTQRTVDFVRPESRAVATQRDDSFAKTVLTAAAWLIGLGVAFALAFTVSRHVPDENRNLLEQWPILQRFEEYQAVQDIEFLKMLHESQSIDKAEKMFTPDTTKRRNER